jgi:antitoxin MazE
MIKLIHTKEIQLVRIGNSKGVRLPKKTLQKYGLTDTIVIEEIKEGILIRNKKDKKLGWEQTYQAMTEEQESWEEFDITLMDGLEGEVFDP